MAGVLTNITSVAKEIYTKNPADDILVRDFTNTPIMSLVANPPQKVYNNDSPYTILKTPAPKNLDFFEQNSMYFLDLYYRASYYFYNCSILNTVIRKIVDESLRNGLEFLPRYQTKCPRCGQEFEDTTKKCRVCGFDGIMIKPDLTEKDLLVNWRGNSLMDEVNRNGWSLRDLCASFLILTLVYNQPLILCKSIYGVDEQGNAIAEIPQEFIPIAPTKARMFYDVTGEPGQEKGFTLRDRTTLHDMVDIEHPENSGFYNGQRLYPARWAVSYADGGYDNGATYYSEKEIFHKVFSIPSMTYGTPICSLIEYVIRAWIAMELRVEKYYNTGHPQGIFVISSITPDQQTAIQQTIRDQMRDDPYSMPMVGIPPGGTDSNKTAKWFPLADNPTTEMMAVKAELQQRVSGAFGVSGLFLGDVHSIKGNSNETQQMAVMDRNLTVIRQFVNSFLKFVVAKFGIKDWIIRVREPADEQTRKKAEDLNKELINAQLAQSIGFQVISLIDGKVELSDTPINFNPANVKSNVNDHIPSSNDQEAHLFGTDIGDSSDLGKNMIRDIATRQKGTSISAEQLGRVIAEMIKNGVDVR